MDLEHPDLKTLIEQSLEYDKIRTAPKAELVTHKLVEDICGQLPLLAERYVVREHYVGWAYNISIRDMREDNYQGSWSDGIPRKYVIITASFKSEHAANRFLQEVNKDITLEFTAEVPGIPTGLARYCITK